MFLFSKQKDLFIKEYVNVLDNALCDEIIERFYLDGRAVPGVTTKGLVPEQKNHTVLFFSGLETWVDIDSIIQKKLNENLRKYVSEIGWIGAGLYDGGYKIQKIEKNKGFFKWHGDYDIRARRVLAFIFYLNTVTRGGETEFLYQKQKIKAERGKLLLFPTWWTHIHRGNVPRNSNKYILSGFIFQEDK